MRARVQASEQEYFFPSQAPAEKPAIKPEIRLTEPVEIVPLATLTPAQPETPKAAPFTMENSLFIGDSRTTGLADYSGMEGVDYFADVGMNVYTVGKRVLPVEGFDEISLDDLLEAKKYDKIYIILPIDSKIKNILSSLFLTIFF